MKSFNYDAHPMGMFISVIAGMSTFHPEANPSLQVRVRHGACGGICMYDAARYTCATIAGRVCAIICLERRVRGHSPCPACVFLWLT
jgi:hypothetical protein